MKKVVFAAFLVGYAVALPVPVIAQKSSSKPTVKRNYVRKNLGFALNQPVGWLPTTKGLLPDMIAAFHKEEEDGYQPAIAITVKDAPGAVMPPTFAEFLDKAYKTQLPDYQFLGSSRFKVAGKDAVGIAFTTRSPKTQVLVNVRRVFVVHRDKLLIFEIDAEVSDYDLLVPAFDKMMSTLIFQP